MNNENTKVLPKDEGAVVERLSDDDIEVIWQTMPGGPAGWLKSFGVLQFARAVEDEINQRRGAQPVAASAAQVGCEGDDGLLRMHSESETCDVCRPASAAGLEGLTDERIFFIHDSTDVGDSAILNFARAIEREVLATQSAKQGAQAGIVQVPRDTLLAIYEAMNYMGEILNGMDACDEEDEEATTPAFDAIRRLLDDSFVTNADTAEVAQDCAPVAEVRDQALEEAARVVLDGRYWNGAPLEIYRTAEDRAAAIRALKSTTNKSEG